MPPNPTKPDYVSLTAGMLIGLMGLYTIPYVVGTAVETLHLSNGAAGWLGSIEIGGVALGSIFLSPFVRRLNARRVAQFGAMTALAANTLSFLIGSVALFALFRAMAGLACGIVLSIMTVRIAATGEAERTYGRVYTGMSVIFALLLFALPEIQAHFGPGYLFVAIAVTLAVLAPRMRRLSDARPMAQAQTTDSPEIPWPSVALLFLSMTLAFGIYGAVYSFSERIGNDLGLTATAMGGTLAASALTAIIGSSLAGALGSRLGRTRPLCGAMLVAGVSYLLILGAHGASTLVVGMVVYGLMTMFFNSYAYGAAAALDPTGRVASALQGYSLIPYALGPGILGTLATDTPYQSLAVPVFVVNLLAIALVIPVVVWIDRGAIKPPALSKN